MAIKTIICLSISTLYPLVFCRQSTDYEHTGDGVQRTLFEELGEYDLCCAALDIKRFDNGRQIRGSHNHRHDQRPMIIIAPIERIRI